MKQSTTARVPRGQGAATRAFSAPRFACPQLLVGGIAVGFLSPSSLPFSSCLLFWDDRAVVYGKCDLHLKSITMHYYATYAGMCIYMQLNAVINH